MRLSLRLSPCLLLIIALQGPSAQLFPVEVTWVASLSLEMSGFIKLNID